MTAAYDNIQRQGLGTPVYEMDEARLVWSQAVLTYAAVGSDVARELERRGDREAAMNEYRAMLRVFADAARQAEAVDGLRRTYEMASVAFAHCHAGMASLQEAAGDLGGAVYHLEEAWRASRIVSNEQRTKLGALAQRCARDIAGIRDAVAAFHGTMPPPATIPITRWDFARHARGWLDAAARAREGARPAVRNSIAVAAFNPHHIQLFFAIACVLYARGHSVDFLWMPCIAFDRRCEPEPIYDRWDEALLAQEMAGFAAGGLPDEMRLLDLRDVALAPAETAFETMADRQAGIDMRNNHRNASLDMTTAATRAEKRNRVLKNVDAMRRMKTYLAATPIDRLLLFNAGVIEYGVVFDVARAAGVPVLEWEQSPPAPQYYMMSVNRRHGDLDMRQLWEAEAARPLDAAARKRVADWFVEAGRGDWRDRAPRGRHVPDAAGRELLLSLGLDPEKPVAALFPNITWDTATLDREVAFESVADWALQTAEFFASHPEWQLVVRSHPVEASASEEFVGQILRRRWPTLPHNVRIVETDERLFSYRLLDAAQLGLYCTGTLGLEMAMMGINAVTGARPPFAGYGFTREAADAAGYLALVESGLADPDASAMTPEQMARAWRFADLYLIQSQKRLPWSYQRFWPSILEAWPMERVLGPDGNAFDPVFSVFAGEVDLPDGIVGEVRNLRPAARG